MTDTVEQTAPEETNTAMITLTMLRKWGACQDGKSWFSDKFPQGAEYGETLTALYADKRYEDARWLSSKVFDKAFSSEIIASDINAIIKLTEDAEIDANSSGYNAQIGSSGNYARIGSSGDDAQIGSSGDDAQIGSSGYNARIGSSGDDAQIGSSGYNARIGASGENSVVASAGINSRVKLGENGSACIAWHDGKRTRFTAIYVGEDGIKSGIWYKIDDSGNAVEAEAA
ncbi:hypothetical protein FKW31_03085 [Acetobacter sp. DmW_136]|uniref:hypothetical protein n=1 Tax=Acetobacter sp. DmW_136 TaxID=2591091 RepID=UPI00123A2618|nr:hypothetical protein [Acetobacter sp. DmW_136]KAA8387644.1 hypothetical protein FKW31_03085 [Acetobacter sp. DmW_136]